MKKRKKYAAVTIAVALMMITGGAAFYVKDVYRATVETDAVADEYEIPITEEENGMLTFGEETAETGILFYPGGKVEYTAYAPLLSRLASEGFFCVLFRMPCNLAVLDVNAADGVTERFPGISHWYMAGHSLGGSMAASYFAKHTDTYDGLILLAAYATEDLSDTEKTVVSLFGSEDGVLNMEKYEKYKVNLPENLQEKVIQGGCHAYFGDYGKQEGDGDASISREEQQKEAVGFVLQSISPETLYHN